VQEQLQKDPTKCGITREREGL